MCGRVGAATEQAWHVVLEFLAAAVGG